MLKFKLNQFNKIQIFRTIPCYFSTNSTTISDIVLKAHHQVGSKIVVKGWVKSLRNQKNAIFIDLGDGSCSNTFQLLVPHQLKPANLSTGASITASGNLSQIHNKEQQQLELRVDTIELTGKCVTTDGYPFAPRKHYPPEYLRQFLHFRPRTNTFAALLRVRDYATLALYNHFNSHGYVNIHTPILTTNDCEGAGETFKVLPDSERVIKSMIKKDEQIDQAYFGKRTYLTVSAQLHLEAAAHGLSKVYSFGPTFRAENSRSRLHLSEFYMLEVEMAFVDRLTDVLDVVERAVKRITQTLIQHCSPDINRCRGGDDKIPPNYQWIESGNFPVLTYAEAVAILTANRGQFTEEFNESDGLGKEHELYLVKYCGNVPTFVVDWPIEMKPFYMKQCTHDKTKVAAFDLLAPGVGEIVGGSLRENNYDVLKARVPNKNGQLDWYLDVRRFGGVPTGGFGMGFERYLQFILNINNIKDVIPFPRWPHNCSL